MAKDQPRHVERRPDREGSRLAALLKAAGAVLFVERAWPPIVWGSSVALLFLAVSWLGVWLVAPRVLRILGVSLFACGLAIAFFPLVRLRWPAMRDIQARLDRDSGDAHNPVSSFADTLANDHDPVAGAMWARHRVQLERSVRAVRITRPAPRMVRLDPYALRFVVALLAFAAASAAGPELHGRLAAAFDWRGRDAVAAALESRVDAWIDPPAYGARPPTIIELNSSLARTLKVFEDSALIVRADSAIVQTRVEGRIESIGDKAVSEGQARERRWTIHGDGKATILRRGVKLAEILFAVTPAGAPTIRLTQTPRANFSGSVTIAYHIDDRFGVNSARAGFALPHEASKPAARSLVEPPQVALQLPLGENGAGEGRTTVDLSDHPWAGAHVLMTLSAVSVSGRTGSSEPVQIRLPQRAFHNPLARALVELRRDLVLDPDHAPKRIEAALRGLEFAPELFGTPSSVYLGLNRARSSLVAARGDADLLDVAALLWAMAQQIENGDATQAERDLRAAEKALREAFRRGASDDEIKKLMQDFREAARRFASKMARKAEHNGAQSPEDSSQQFQDLDRLMDRMEEAARDGTREEAEAMLDQMQDIFENMRDAEEESDGASEQAVRKQLNELDKLLRDQQALRDDTFRSDQRERDRKRSQGSANPPGQQNEAQADIGPGEADSKGSPGDANPDRPQLAQRQRALRDRLAELQSALKNLGMGSGKALDDAKRAMTEAEGDLRGENHRGGDGDTPRADDTKGTNSAVEAQGRAIEAMREGAQGLQKQMSQGQGRGRRGKGGYAARRIRSGEMPGDDPLGRGREGTFGRDEGSLRVLSGETERARRVMEELRRRLSNPSRPIEERNYLERLMKRD